MLFENIFMSETESSLLWPGTVSESKGSQIRPCSETQWIPACKISWHVSENKTKIKSVSTWWICGYCENQLKIQSA